MSHFLQPILCLVSCSIYLKWRQGSHLVFEIRDIWPLTMIHEGSFSRWHPLALYLRFIELWGYRRADLIVGTMPNLKQHVIESWVYKPDSAFHTCGIGPPGEICWMIVDPTISIDGVALWENGKLHPERFEVTRRVLEDSPALAAAFQAAPGALGLG